MCKKFEIIQPCQFNCRSDDMMRESFCLSQKWSLFACESRKMTNFSRKFVVASCESQKINIFSSCFNHKKRALSKAKTTRNNVREIQFVGLFVTFYLSELSTRGAKWDVEEKLPNVPTNHLNCNISRRSTLGQAGSGLVILMLMKMKVGLCGLCLVAHLPTVKARILHRIDIAKVRYCTGIVTLAKQL